VSMKRIIIAASLLLAAIHCGAMAFTINTPVETVVKAYRITDDFEMARLMVTYCREYNVPITLALAVAFNESSFNRKCISYNKQSADIGLFQLNTKSYNKYTRKELLHLETNIKFGISHIAYALNRNNGNVSKALATYNAGHSRVLANKIPVSTKEYIDKVIKTTIEYEKLWR
jgi:soluble lytic murein transglycosylase-like protein